MQGLRHADLALLAVARRRLLHVLLPRRLQGVVRGRMAAAVALVQLHLGLGLHACAHPARGSMWSGHSKNSGQLYPMRALMRMLHHMPLSSSHWHHLSLHQQTQGAAGRADANMHRQQQRLAD